MEKLKGRKVVVDTDSSYIYIGILADMTGDCLIMEETDVHDKNDLGMSKEKYVLETRRYGIKENRHRVYVLRDRVVSVSPLEDVLEF